MLCFPLTIRPFTSCDPSNAHSGNLEGTGSVTRQLISPIESESLSVGNAHGLTQEKVSISPIYYFACNRRRFIHHAAPGRGTPARQGVNDSRVDPPSQHKSDSTLPGQPQGHLLQVVGSRRVDSITEGRGINFLAASDSRSSERRGSPPQERSND